MERLQKIMAEAGIGSRRKCEDMIRDGQVKVNGHHVTTLPVLVDPQIDVITVSGRKLRMQRKVYFLLNKPRKVVCTNADPEGRLRAIDLLTGVKERVFPVGRLDTDSTGLLIMTNDGELANQLTHPRYGVHKTYVVEINGSITGEAIEQLKKSIRIKQGQTAMEKIKILHRGPRQSLLEVTLREGRNRQVRLMLARLGYKVKNMTQVKMGGLVLKGLGLGKFRPLTSEEIKSLRRQGGVEKAKP